MADLTKDCRQQGQTFNTYYMPEGSHLWTNLSCTVTQITSGFIDENIKVGRSYITHLMPRVNSDEAKLVCVHSCVYVWASAHARVCLCAHRVCACVHMNICVTRVSVYISVPLVWTCVCVRMWVCLCVLSCMCGGHTRDIWSIASFVCDAPDGSPPRSHPLSFSFFPPSFLCLQAEPPELVFFRRENKACPFPTPNSFTCWKIHNN